MLNQNPFGRFPPAAPVAELAPNVSGLRVLVVDDSESNRNLIRGFLKRTEAVVETAENGAVALAMFCIARYDVVLMDVEMPVMDGYLATFEIRRFEKDNARTPTPVVALTAHTLKEVAGKIAAAGFNSVLTKPIIHSALLEVLLRHPKGETIPAPSALPVHFEGDIQEMAPGYIKNIRSHVSVYKDALNEGDFATIQRFGHNMKGTGSCYGFPALTEIGGEIERAAAHFNFVEVRESVDRFKTFLNGLPRNSAPNLP